MPVSRKRVYCAKHGRRCSRTHDKSKRSSKCRLVRSLRKKRGSADKKLVRSCRRVDNLSATRYNKMRLRESRITKRGKGKKVVDLSVPPPPPQFKHSAQKGNVVHAIKCSNMGEVDCSKPASRKMGCRWVTNKKSGKQYCKQSATRYHVGENAKRVRKPKA